MDTGHHGPSLSMLATALVIHPAACGCLWRFLHPAARRCFIAACRELDFYCLQAVRGAARTPSPITMDAFLPGGSAVAAPSADSSGESDLHEEAITRREDQNAARWHLDDFEHVVPEVSAAVALAETAGRLIRAEALDRGPTAAAPPPLIGSARVFRSGVEECDVSWRGTDTISMLLNSAAATCRDDHGFLGWHVDGLTVHLRALDYRPSFDTTLEETAHLRVLRARRLLRPGCFAYRVARRRRAGS